MYQQGRARNGVNSTQPGELHILRSEGFTVVKIMVQLEGVRACSILLVRAQEKLLLKHEDGRLPIVWVLC
jgi:hypothetical protein